MLDNEAKSYLEMRMSYDYAEANIRLSFLIAVAGNDRLFVISLRQAKFFQLPVRV